jgi:F0F1-type ATP synthase assembly protein I
MAFDLSAKRELNKGFGDALAVAVELAVTPAIFAFLGWRLDAWLGTTPLFLLVFFLFTFTYVAWREYTRYKLRMDEHQRELLGPKSDRTQP